MRRRTTPFIIPIIILGTIVAVMIFCYWYKFIPHDSVTSSTSSQLPPPPPTIYIHCSVTVDAKIAEALVRRYCDINGVYNMPDTTRISRTVSQIDATFQPDTFDGNLRNAKVRFLIDQESTDADANAIIEAAQGKCALAFSAHLGESPTSNQTKETIVGYDYLDIILNSSNNENFLTTDRLRDIFCQTEKNWKNHSAICKFTLQDCDVCNDFNRKFGIGVDTDQFKAGVASGKITKLNTMDEIIQKVASNEDGIGYCSSASLISDKNVKKVRVVGVGQDQPAALALDDPTGNYDMLRAVVLNVPKSSVNKDKLAWIANQLVAFAGSGEGQEIIEAHRLMGIKKGQEIVEKHKLVKTSLPVPVLLPVNYDNVRITPSWPVSFKEGKADPEPGRTVPVHPGKDNKNVVVFGFTNTGEQARNQHLSMDRANRVARMLKDRGFQVQHIEGLGSKYLKMTNMKPDKNTSRRVEVYVLSK